MLDKNIDNISYEDYAAFEDVRRYGRWNMFDSKAKMASGLDDETYFGVIHHFNELTELYKEKYSKEHTKKKEKGV